jgi:hypothetical protein
VVSNPSYMPTVGILNHVSSRFISISLFHLSLSPFPACFPSYNYPLEILSGLKNPQFAAVSITPSLFKTCKNLGYKPPLLLPNIVRLFNTLILSRGHLSRDMTPSWTDKNRTNLMRKYVIPKACEYLYL